jgi:hypothetical protein
MDSYGWEPRVAQCGCFLWKLPELVQFLDGVETASLDGSFRAI